MITDLEKCVVKRPSSLFAEDLANHSLMLNKLLKNARLLVIGGAGTIGFNTCKVLSQFQIQQLDIVDHNENGLAELIRYLRAQGKLGILDLRTVPLDFSNKLFYAFLNPKKPYDFILNFAALKHVRSEKDVFSLLQMLNVNVLAQYQLKSWLQQHQFQGHYFSVSSDKAANPTSAMGATKRLMEDVIFFDDAYSTSARFANVAFSNGSLLESWLKRIDNKQVLAVPVQTKRYFITPQEAGEICCLAAMLAPSKHLLYPRLEPSQLVLLEETLEQVLSVLNLTPVWFDSVDEAKSALPVLIPQNKWAVLRTPLDTSGEKAFEEFYTDQEILTQVPFKALGALRATFVDPALLDDFCNWLTSMLDPVEIVFKKEEIIKRLKQYLPAFQHRETGILLDQRI